MRIDKLKNALPDYAKDLRLNLATVMTQEGAPDLNLKQIYSVALTSSYAIKNQMMIESLLTETANLLSDHELIAAKSAATIMAMNNIYYRFTHLVNDKTYLSMPAKLRMNVIANSGIDKIDFELNCLAVSAINGCGMCMDAHTHELTKAGVTRLAIQSAIRIAAVLNAVALGLEIS